ncbi:MAG: mechanosensitive ion channel [Candidatus Promineofilum sp.]|nr:mechanosensitive ion channel [Promineifilum sp.]
MCPSSAHHRLCSLLLIPLLLVVLACPAAVAARQEEPTPTPQATPLALEGAPVIVNGQELFRLQTRVGSITATERATLVSDHIGRLANNPFSGELLVTVVDTETATDIVIGDEVLVTVSDADAAAEGRDRAELAQEWAALIQTAISDGQASVGIGALTAGLGISLAVLLALLVLLWLINRFSNWLVDKLDPTTESGRLPPALANSEIYQSGLFSRTVRLLLRLFKIVLALFLVTVAIPVVLRAFPQTHELGTRVRGSLLAPLAKLWDGIVAFLPDLIFLLVLAALTWLITRLIHLLFREVERGVIRLPSFEPEWAGFTGRMVTILVVIIAFIIGFTSLPISQLPVFQGISAFAALLLTLASSSAIANIIAGIILTYTGAFRIGEIIRIQNTTGEVAGKYLLTTRVRTFKNEVVSFPNSLVLSNSVTNYSRLAREGGLTLYTTVTIGYDVAWQKVHELLIGAALDTPDILKQPAPFVLQKALNDFNVSYELNALTNKAELLPALYSALHRHIQERFAAAGVEIMSPNYVAVRDGNEPALPQTRD